MTKNIYVKVTDQDIIEGRKDNAFRCPIAKAINKVLNIDYPNGVEITHGLCLVGKELEGVLPIEARRFIRLYDNGFTVQSFEFDIELFNDSDI